MFLITLVGSQGPQCRWWRSSFGHRRWLERLQGAGHESWKKQLACVSFDMSCFLAVCQVHGWYSCSTRLLRRRDNVVMEPTTFGRASFLDWTLSGCATDRSVPSISRCCRRHFHEGFLIVATWSCALVRDVYPFHIMWYYWLGLDLGWFHLRAPCQGANPRRLSLSRAAF
jgi:hypothetical protein